MSIPEKVMAASKALDKNDLIEAGRLISEVESELSTVAESNIALNIGASLGGVMIDLGTWTHDEELVVRGIRYATGALSERPDEIGTVASYYNAANGYLSLWQMRASSTLKNGRIDEACLQAKRLFRQALDLARSQPTSLDSDLHKQLLVNYANCLDSIGRSVEAIEYYNRAIEIDASMGEALGNKAMTLRYVAPLARGHTHRFLLEAHRLLGKALQQPLHRRTVQIFERNYRELESLIRAHDEMRPEEIIPSSPVSPFHASLRDFCVRHQLFLTPATFTGTDQAPVYGDPMFISEMVAPLHDEEKFARYITFLNQIKQDYVLARYLLVQSQYRSDIIEVIDRDVALYYPLDYSLHSAYIQMMKVSLRLSIDVLDKIAFFVRDYCAVSSIEQRHVNFRNLWAARASRLKLRPELAARRNPFLFALFDLALDLGRNGDYARIYDHRNALTHRYMVIHDMISSGQANDHVPRIQIEEFLEEVIFAMQLTRAAVMYLIMFVDLEEGRERSKSRYGLIPGIPLDDVFRWVPPHGE